MHWLLYFFLASRLISERTGRNSRSSLLALRTRANINERPTVAIWLLQGEMTWFFFVSSFCERRCAEMDLVFFLYVFGDKTAQQAEERLWLYANHLCVCVSSPVLRRKRVPQSASALFAEVPPNDGVFSLFRRDA
jgi:hypothetical protein